jgi:hypothetical protein
MNKSKPLNCKKQADNKNLTPKLLPVLYADKSWHNDGTEEVMGLLPSVGNRTKSFHLPSIYKPKGPITFLLFGLITQ